MACTSAFPLHPSTFPHLAIRRPSAVPASADIATDPRLDEAREVLHRFWGYPDFRPGQDQAIRNVLSGGDSLTVMPTGGGKSLCYQVPALLLPGLTMVVSPLISLMKDQVDALEKAGVPATFLNSTLGGAEMQARLDAAERGEYRLVYVAPERFEGEGFQRRLSRLDVSLLAVDEAHCISEWGHDFRPAYTRLGKARERMGNPPVAALTATATPEVREDIVRQLSLQDPAVLVTGFDRRNLVWHVLRAKNDSEKDRLLLRLLRGREGSAVVYAATRKNVDALTALLTGVGVRAVGYHAGLGDAERKRVQDAFMSGRSPVVVATNAFGMGIDKPDVRIVVHYNMPGNLEAYYQEAGRAGRDRGPAECVLLHAYPDRFTHEFFIEQSNPARGALEAAMDTLRGLCDAEGLVSMSPMELARMVPGVKGDRQLGSVLRVLEQHGLVRGVQPGAPVPVRVRLVARPDRIARELAGRGPELEFLRALWRRHADALYGGVEMEWRELDRAAGGRGLAAGLLDALAAEQFVDWRALAGEGVWVLDRTTPTARLAIDWRGLERKKQRELRKLQQMQNYAYTEGCRRGYVLRYFGDPDAMDHCGACDNCLQSAPLAAVEPGEAGAAKRERARRERPAAAAEGEAPPVHEALYGRLRDLRRDLAQREDLPPYMVFPENALRGLAAAVPTTPEGMLRVSGIGSRTLERWGAAMLEVLRGYAEEQGLPVGDDGGFEPAARTRDRRSRRDRDRAAAGIPADDGAPPTPEQQARYGRLKELRARLAKEAGLPSYCIFHDRTLVEMARVRPTTEAALLQVSGVGEMKMEKYGAAFLETLREG